MKFEFKKLKNVTCTYTVTINKKDLVAKENKAKNMIIGNIKIPGFRKKGNLPKQLLNKYLTDTKIAIEATRLFIQEAYEFALDCAEKDNLPLPNKIPEIKIDLSKNLDGIIIFTFTPKAKVTIPLLTSMNINLNEDDYKIDDKKINEQILRLKDEFSTMVLREDDDPIQLGDTVILDYEGHLQGQTFEGGSAKNHELVIGSKKFIPGFEEQLIGLKTNEEATLPISFPKDYFIKHLRGLTIDFTVKIHEIRYKELVKDDKEFIKLLNKKDIKTMNDVKKFAKKTLLKMFDEKKKDDYWRLVLNESLKHGDFYFPEDDLVREFNKIRHKTEKELETRKLSIKMYAEVLNTSEQLIFKNMRKEAEWKIMQNLAILGIAKNLGITIKDKDIIDYAKTILRTHQGKFSDEILNRFVNSQKAGLYSLLLELKTRENVLELFERSMKAKTKTQKKPKTTPKTKSKTQSLASSKKKVSNKKGDAKKQKKSGLKDNKKNIKVIKKQEKNKDNVSK